MMAFRGIALAIAGALVLSGCYTTTYVNFVPETGKEATHGLTHHRRPQYWRSFWLWGWIPGEMVIFADQACKGSEHIDRIVTQRSFVQGVVAAVAGYYINVYSPYSGQVVCDHSKVDKPY